MIEKDNKFKDLSEEEIEKLLEYFFMHTDSALNLSCEHFSKQLHRFDTFSFWKCPDCGMDWDAIHQ